MQNDNEARQELEAQLRQKNEEYTKQLAYLLQRRQHLRQTSRVSEDAESQQSLTIPLDNSAYTNAGTEAVIPKQSFALVVVSYNFRNLPAISERTKDVAGSLFDSLVDQHFNRFSRRGSRLLVNPSVIEFQDTMVELKKICAEEPNSSFFMCLATHGARVTRGTNKGSYVLFSETRLSSEDELVLTAIHERELAKMVHDIPCKNKFVALELCQVQEPSEKLVDDVATIRHRIHEQFLSQFYRRIVQLRLQTLYDSGSSHDEITEETVRTDPKLLNFVLMESCDVKSEVPVRTNEERVSNFLLRFRDAFRGAALSSKLNEEYSNQQNSRHSLFAKEVLQYVCREIRSDAAKQNAFVRAEYESQARTSYEKVAEFPDITHTPSVLGAEHAIDFGLGEIPEPPIISPTPPAFVASTLNSISLTWRFTAPAANLPAILGYHIERRGHGRACADGAGEASLWKRAAAFQIESYEAVVRNGISPPTAVTVYGLSTDTAYCFRARARTAGGWGPFSASSPGYRTLAATCTLSQHETIRLAALQDGANGVAKLMDKHTNTGAVHRYAAEILATMAMKGPDVGLQSLQPVHLPVVVAVRNAMLKFKMDLHLQQQGCLLFGRLAGISPSWKLALQSVESPPISSILQGIVNRTERDYNIELTRCATWALGQLQP